MKLNKLLLASTTLLLALGVTACGNTGNSTKTSTSQSSSKNEIISQNKELRQKFNKIKVGDLAQEGQGGSTLTNVEKLLGVPSSTSSSTTNGIKVKDETFVKGNVTIVIQTINNNVVSKDISGFKFSSRPTKITLATFNKVKDGSSYETIVKQFGEPDSLNESLIMGTKNLTGTWLTGVKGDATASATFVFNNNRLESKNQTDLK
ncbi:DUF3862 domain-containing protein [Lactobacillus sp. PV037]|uniref:DUF3862 domain-containing protein n=1 Tax=Lactobacillus sp. PV037 TaxID=2594496 RepID=UPI00223EA542|nr:DUF3862 domain-containing protein [Lactobacillus sp. PV037]QNQ83700.1 DUF3862 domain-containing protein [Lactobacillus sp. PV037]